MLGDVRAEALIESEFADEYQSWLGGDEGRRRHVRFDVPVGLLALRRPLFVSIDLPVLQVARRMQAESCSTALVRRGGNLVGIFSERDLLTRVVVAGRDPRVTPVGDVMTADPDVVPQSITLAQLMRKLSLASHRHLPVVDPLGQATAVLSLADVLRFVGEAFPAEVLNAPPEGVRSAALREGA
jgi:CBS domain-containing protein